MLKLLLLATYPLLLQASSHSLEPCSTYKDETICNNAVGTASKRCVWDGKCIVSDTDVDWHVSGARCMMDGDTPFPIDGCTERCDSLAGKSHSCIVATFGSTTCYQIVNQECTIIKPEISLSTSPPPANGTKNMDSPNDDTTTTPAPTNTSKTVDSTGIGATATPTPTRTTTSNAAPLQCWEALIILILVFVSTA